MAINENIKVWDVILLINKREWTLGFVVDAMMNMYAMLAFTSIKGKSCKIYYSDQWGGFVGRLIMNFDRVHNDNLWTSYKWTNVYLFKWVISVKKKKTSRALHFW